MHFDKFVFNIHNYKITKKADLVSDPVIGYHTSGRLRSGSLIFYKKIINDRYADRINSRGMSRVFCDLRSQKTPRGILPVNSNYSITDSGNPDPRNS